MIEQRTPESRTQIAVGVDGSTTAAAAVDYGIRLAQEQERTLHLVHVAPQIGPFPPLSILAGDRVLGHGQALLADLVQRARLAAPGLEICSTLAFGPRKSELAKAAQRAAVLVLGRHASTELHGMPTGSTAATLAAALECPVRVVPGDWKTRPHNADVVVGLKHLEGAEPLVARGLELAAGSGGVLVLAHAWYLPAGYEGVLTPSEIEIRNAHAAAALEHGIVDLRTRWPDVPVQAKVEVGSSDDVLARLCSAAGLLLLGRPEHEHVFSHLGRTARALLQTAAAPIEIGPRVAARRPEPETDAGGASEHEPTTRLEQRGALLR
jgi:nucleotide-binding universal stress UspA family protein